MQQQPFNYDNTVKSLDDIDFEQDAFITLLSCRKSGKSFMIKDLTYQLLKKSKIKYIYVFSATAKKAKTAGYDWIDPKCILPLDSIDNGVEYFLNLQEKCDAENKILLIFDDIDLGKSYADSIDKLAIRGRHYGITTILSAQITNYGISGAIKANSQYIFVRQLTANAIKKDVYSTFSNTEFEYPRDLYRFIKQNNRNYQFVLYINDNRDPEQSIMVVRGQKRNFTYNFKVKSNEQLKKEIEAKKFRPTMGFNDRNPDTGNNW